MRVAALVWLPMACAAFAGCSGLHIAGSDQTDHYLVIGIGIVSTPKPQGSSAVRVSKVQALGMVVSSHPGFDLALGYSSGSSIAVRDGARDVVVEVSQKPGGPLRVDAARAFLAGETESERSNHEP